MAETQTLEDKFNEGRLMSAIGIHQNILQNGLLPEQPLQERATTVKGILQGLIETGEWQQALGTAYEQGPARLLLDKKDLEEINKTTFEAAKKEKEEYHLRGSYYGKSDIEKIITTHWTPEQVLTILTKTPLKEDDKEELFNKNKQRFTEQQKQQYHNANGEKEFAKGDYKTACIHFANAENNARINEIQQQLAENLTPQNLRQTLALAERYAKDNELVKKIVRTALDEFPDQIDNYDKNQIYKLYPNKIQLKPEEATILKKAHAQQLSSWDIKRENHDEETKLYWAQAHTTRTVYNDPDPAIAYEIMAEQNYQGPERWTALVEFASIAIRAHKWGEFKKTAKYEDVKKVEQKLTLEERAWTALIYDDKENMREYSKQIARETTQDKNIDKTKKAYQLWIKGNGNQNDDYVNKLRQELLEHDVQQRKECNYHTIGNWLEHKDKEGYVQMHFEAFKAKDFKRAYELAKHINDQDLIPITARCIIAESPEEALCRYKDDQLITELAIDALATKYGVQKDKINALVQQYRQ